MSPIVVLLILLPSLSCSLPIAGHRPSWELMGLGGGGEEEAELLNPLLAGILTRTLYRWANSQEE